MIVRSTTRSLSPVGGVDDTTRTKSRVVHTSDVHGPATEEASHLTQVSHAQVSLLDPVGVGSTTGSTTVEVKCVTHLTAEAGVVVDLGSQVDVSPGSQTIVEASGVAVLVAKANVATQRNVSVCKGRSRNQHGHKKAEHDALIHCLPLFFPMLSGAVPSIPWGS